MSPLLQRPLMGGLYQSLMAITNDAYMKHWCNDSEWGGGSTRIKHCSSFDVLLTVHLSIFILVIN